jgi:hypothetical protein
MKRISERTWRSERCLAASATAALVATLVIFGAIAVDRPASAGGGGGMGGGGGGGGGASAAAAVGNAGIGACASNSGKVLYDCVANVLDRMGNNLNRAPETQRALQTAASQLRSATSKAQALSAIAQCRSAIAGILRQAREAGGDGTGLSAIAGVLSRAAALIQQKG